MLPVYLLRSFQRQLMVMDLWDEVKNSLLTSLCCDLKFLQILHWKVIVTCINLYIICISHSIIMTIMMNYLESPTLLLGTSRPPLPASEGWTCRCGWEISTLHVRKLFLFNPIISTIQRNSTFLMCHWMHTVIIHEMHAYISFRTLYFHTDYNEWYCS